VYNHEGYDIMGLYDIKKALGGFFMLKKLILLVVFLMTIAVPYASAAASKTSNQLLIHWKFDNSLINYGTAGSSYDLPLPTPSPKAPPRYTTGFDSVGALSFIPGDTYSLQAVKDTLISLPLANATISFNLKQGTSWNHYLLIC
jgi:hypothetical protein